MNRKRNLSTQQAERRRKFSRVGRKENQKELKRRKSSIRNKQEGDEGEKQSKRKKKRDVGVGGSVSGE